MEHTYPFSAIGVAFLSFVSGFGLAFDEAVSEPKNPKMLARGRLIAYDAEQNHLIVMKSPKTIVSLPLARDVKVYIDLGRTGVKLDELPRDIPIGLLLSADQSRILEVHITGPSLRRKIESVNSVEGTIHVSIGRKAETFQLARNVLVKTGHPNASMSDVKPGALAQLLLSHDRAKVISINLLSENR